MDIYMVCDAHATYIHLIKHVQTIESFPSIRSLNLIGVLLAQASQRKNNRPSLPKVTDNNPLRERKEILALI